MKIRNITAAALAGLALAAGGAQAASASATADGYPVYYDTYATQGECTSVGKQQAYAGTADGYFCEEQADGWDLYLTYWV